MKEIILQTFLKKFNVFAHGVLYSLCSYFPYVFFNFVCIVIVIVCCKSHLQKITKTLDQARAIYAIIMKT